MTPFLFSTFLSFLISLLSAWAASSFLTTRIPLIGSLVGLSLTENPGIAFGIRLPPLVQSLLIAAALVFAIVLALKSARTRLSAIAFGLIVGGGFANVVDRLPDGFVTDFFQVGSFPVFNVADSCISIGVALALADQLKLFRKSP